MKVLSLLPEPKAPPPLLQAYFYELGKACLEAAGTSDIRVTMTVFMLLRGAPATIVKLHREER